MRELRMSPSATIATQKTAASQRTSRDQARHQSQLGAISATPATQRSMSPSAMPATQSEGRCHQLPRVPQKRPRHHGGPAATKRITRPSPVPKCHTCSTK